MLNPNGGAIALLSTTRLVYSAPNYNLNTKFIKTIFKKENGEFPRLGDIFTSSSIVYVTVVGVTPVIKTVAVAVGSHIKTLLAVSADCDPVFIVKLKS